MNRIVDRAETETPDRVTPPFLPEAGADYLPALMAAARFYGRGTSAKNLTRGLPSGTKTLPPRHLREAAARAQLLVEPGAARLETLTPDQLPVLVELADGQVLALLRRDRQGYITGRGRKDHDWIADKDLRRRGIAALNLVRPQFFFDHRSLHYDLPQSKSWFVGPLLDNSWIYGFAALAGLIINLAAIAVSMFSMAVYDRVIPNNSMGSLIGLTVGVLIILGADLLLKFLRGYLIDVVGRRFDVRVGARIFAQMLAVDSRARPASSGALANLVREFDSVRDFFTSATLLVLADMPFAVLFILVIWWIAGPLVVVVAIGLAAMLIAGLVLQVPLSKSIGMSFRESSQKAAFLHEVAVGLDTVKTSNAQSWARRQWEHLLSQTAHTGMATRRLSLAFSTVSGSITSLITVATVAYGAMLVAEGKLTSGGIIAAVILSGRCLAPFAQITGLMSRWHQTKLAIGALDKLMQAPSEDSGQGAELLQRFPISGELAFQGVGFTYPQAGGAMAPNAPALANVGFSVPAGQSVGIIGRVGSGKTSLLKLIVRLNDPATGNVKVDGVDVRQIHPAELRAQVGYVGQEALLFHGTIRDNITIGKPDASDEEILRAATIAGLQDVLAHTALGLGAPVGERGGLLSGGQRQSVALARALVMDPAILLLDEPTSMMDNTTETRFLAALAEARRGKTTLIVTHKPQVLQIASRVLVMEAGRLVADGPRDEVIARLAASPTAPARPQVPVATP